MAKNQKSQKKQNQSQKKVQVKKPAEVLGVSKSRKKRGAKNRSMQQPTQQRILVIRNGKKHWEWR